MFRILFLILITLFVPLICFAGYKVYDSKNPQKLYKAFTLVLLGLELIRFFVSAAFYDKAVTPSPDVKLGAATALVILGLFASYNTSKHSQNLKQVFAFVCLTPFILGLINPNSYVNALDVNGVCKAMYMLECGFAVSISLFYYLSNEFKFSAINILWATLAIVGFAGINALTIYCWEIATPLNAMWFVNWAICLVMPTLVYLVQLLVVKIKTQKHR